MTASLPTPREPITDGSFLITRAWYAFLAQLQRGSTTSTASPVAYTVNTAPDPAIGAGTVIYVSDETGGATMAFSDGSAWRRVQDRAIIS